MSAKVLFAYNTKCRQKYVVLQCSSRRLNVSGWNRLLDCLELLQFSYYCRLCTLGPLCFNLQIVTSASLNVVFTSIKMISSNVTLFYQRRFNQYAASNCATEHCSSMTASEDPFSGAVPLRKLPLQIGLFFEAVVLREPSLKMDFQRRSSLQNRL